MKKWLRSKALLARADWHVHTSFSDGESTVDEYCRRAVANGLRSIAFTEHARRRLSYDFDRFLAEVEQARQKYPLQILSGCEAKALDVSGALDASEDVLQSCDLVVGVFHSFPSQDRAVYLAALEAMLGNPYVQVWGHPLLFSHRHGIELSESDLDKLAGMCVQHDVLIERNLRYELPDDGLIRQARQAGAHFVVSSDAHRADDLLTEERLVYEWQRLSQPAVRI